MALSFKYKFVSAVLVSTIPTGIKVILLLFKYKYFSAGLLSNHPTGIKVILFTAKFSSVINLSPLNASAGMKEIRL